MNNTPETTTAPVDWAKGQRWALIAAVVGFGAYLVLGFVNMSLASGHEGVRQFFLSYLVGFMFWAGVTFGSFALRFIDHLCGTSWGVLLRPMFHAESRCIWLIGLLFIPVAISMFMGENSPYWWAHEMNAEGLELHGSPGAVAAGVKDLREKHDDYLFPAFALPRSVVYFAFYFVCALILNKWVMAERHGDAFAHEKLKNWSGPLLMLWAVFGTFAATDWVMSLEDGWASTMFPVIYGVTHLLTALVFSSIVFMTMVHHEPLAGQVRAKHKIDIGSWTLALTLVWSYTSFSQFLLVWVGNLPEEIRFFLKRTVGGWEWLSYALCVLFFFLPFLLLLFRDIKTRPHRLRLVQIQLLIMAALNVLWWIDPALSHTGCLHFPMSIGALVGVGGVYAFFFLKYLKEVPLLTPHEAYMIQGEHHHSHVAAHAEAAHGHG